MEDLISRQAAIEAVHCHVEIKNKIEVIAVQRATAEIIGNIAELPSAEPKTGEWVEEDEYGDLWVCDQCGFASEHRDNYCPNCGAYMGGKNNE